MAQLTKAEWEIVKAFETGTLQSPRIGPQS